MITVAFMLWHDPQAVNRAIYTYAAKHVRTLQKQVNKRLTMPHECVLLTDGKRQDFDFIRTIPLDKRMHIAGTRFAKLCLFAPEAKETIGERILYLDLDTVVTGCLDPLVDRSEDLVLWRNPNFGVPRRAFYNTSIMLLRAGSRPEFFAEFDPRTTPGKLRVDWGGTDQAWISSRASKEEAHWTAADGVYGAGRLRDIAPGVGSDLPSNARVVFFPGKREPMMEETKKKHPWIAEHQL